MTDASGSQDGSREDPDSDGAAADTPIPALLPPPPLATNGAVAGLRDLFPPEDRAATPPAPESTPCDAAPLPAVPGYEILSEVGRGGMGVVYRARQVGLGRVVALKMIRYRTEPVAEQRTRFATEAHALARLQHPHIVQVHEVGEVEGQPYLCMEYVEGGTLADRLARTPLPPRAAAVLVKTLARAVHYAHQQGVVHRDLKPGNVLLAPLSGPLPVASDEAGPLAPTTDEWYVTTTPKIADFGLAKRLDEEPGQTQTGHILGTPSYMAPEQAEGKKEVGPACDVYALGAILYEALTGRPPFKAATTLETLEQVRSNDPAPPRQLQPGLPRDLETICLKCLQKGPAKRYASAEALAEDLRRFGAGEPILARPAGRVERLLKWARRRPAAAALAVVSVLAATLGVVGVVWHDIQLRAAVQRAERGEKAALEAERRTRADYRKASETIRQILEPLKDHKFAGVPRLRELQRRQYEEAVAFYEHVIREVDDADAEIRFDVARACGEVSTFEQMLGRNEPAEAHLRRAIDLLERLHAEDPDNVEYTRYLTGSCNNLGCLFGPRDLQEAETWHRRALQLREELVAAQPDVAEWQAALAETCHNVGALYLAGKLPDRPPGQWFEKAMEIRARLFREHPDNPVYAVAAAQSATHLALYLDSSGAQDRAAEFYRWAYGLLEPLAKQHPEEAWYAIELASVAMNWSLLLNLLAEADNNRLQAAQGTRDQQPDAAPPAAAALLFIMQATRNTRNQRAGAALGLLDRAIPDIEAVLRTEPDDPVARKMLWNAYGGRATSYRLLERWPESIADWDRLVKLSEEPKRNEMRSNLALVLAQAGNISRAADEAKDLATRPNLSADSLHQLACAYGLCIMAVNQDGTLPVEEKAKRAEEYGAEAVKLLQGCRDAGGFKDETKKKQLKLGPEMAPLREREDYKKLLREVEGNR